MKRLLRPLPLTVLVGTIALVALLAFGLSGQGTDTTLDEAIAKGERPAPPKLDLPPLSGDGPNQTLADYRGKVVVLNIWASWCAPCRDESPLLEKWHKDLSTRGGLVLGVDTQDVDGDAKNFIKEFGLTYPQLRDKSGDQINAWGAAAYPETFVIDKQGRVAALRRGPVDEEFMQRAVEPLLEERS
jgi:cytochrome c biogenesis protein CcmG/thiol:disulfide interchange protein DsbE